MDVHSAADAVDSSAGPGETRAGAHIQHTTHTSNDDWSAASHIIDRAAIACYSRIGAGHHTHRTARHVRVCHDMCVMVAADHTMWDGQQVQQWLTQRGMHFAVEAFRDNNVTGIVLADLNHAMLVEMGVMMSVHQVQVLKEVAQLTTSASGVLCIDCTHRSTQHGPGKPAPASAVKHEGR